MGKIVGLSVGVTGCEEAESEEVDVDIESVDEGEGDAVGEGESESEDVAGARVVGVLAVGLRPSRRTTSVLSTSIEEGRKEKEERNRTLYKHTKNKKSENHRVCVISAVLDLECLK